MFPRVLSSSRLPFRIGIKLVHHFGHSGFSSSFSILVQTMISSVRTVLNDKEANDKVEFIVEDYEIIDAFRFEIPGSNSS